MKLKHSSFLIWHDWKYSYPKTEKSNYANSQLEKNCGKIKPKFNECYVILQTILTISAAKFCFIIILFWSHCDFLFSILLENR